MRQGFEQALLLFSIFNSIYPSHANSQAIDSTVSNKTFEDLKSTEQERLITFNHTQLGNLVFGGNFNGINSLNNNNLTDYYDSNDKKAVLQSLITAPDSSTDRLLVNSNGQLFAYQNKDSQAVTFSDGLIEHSCMLGDEETIIIAGNFTRIWNNSISGGIAAINSSNILGNITELSSREVNSTLVNALYCEDTSIYAGGSFDIQNTSGIAVSNLSNAGSWSVPSFGGFKLGGNVSAIAKFEDNIVFGGEFTYPSLNVNTTFNDSAIVQPGYQIVSLKDANATGYNTSSSVGTDASSILCPGGDGWTSGINSVTGYVNISLPHVSYLSKIRIYNNDNVNNKAKTFMLQSYPPGGIMNLTYTDNDGNTQSCTADCPLPESGVTDGYTEFSFVNLIPAEYIRITLVDFYEQSAGINGIMLFEQDQTIYANNDFNLPRDCNLQYQTGEVITNGTFTSEGDYIQVNITDKSSLSDYNIRFQPIMSAYTSDAAEYQILLHTPGCSSTDSCSSRGAVNVTVYPGFGDSSNTVIWQTNEEDKYDPIYFGIVSTGAYINVAPVLSSQVPLDFVAYKVSLKYQGNSSDSLKTRNLFEFSPSNFSRNDAVTNGSTVVGLTAINALNLSAPVNDICIFNDTIYVASSNATFVSRNDTSFDIIDGIAEVSKFYYSNDNLFAVGSNDTYLLNKDGMSVTALNVGYVKSIAELMLGNDSYSALFAGDISTNTVKLLDSNAKVATALDGRIKGHVSTSYQKGDETILLGSLKVIDKITSDSSFLLGTSQTNSSDISSFSSTNTNTSSQLEQVFDGLYVNSTHGVLIGQFTDAEHNVDNSVQHIVVFTDQSISRLPLAANDTIADNSSFNCLDTKNGSLVAFGGNISGVVNNTILDGLLLYNMTSSETSFSLLPRNNGTSSNSSITSITALAFKPNSTLIVAAGSFSESGCGPLCIYDYMNQSWLPTSDFNLKQNSVINQLLFETDDKLVVGGDLSMSGSTSEFAILDFSDFSIATLPELPGPVDNFLLNNRTLSSKYVVSGKQSTNQQVYLKNYDATSKLWSDMSNVPDLLNGSQISRLSLMNSDGNSSEQLVGISGNLIMNTTYGPANVSMMTFDGDNWSLLYAASALNSDSSPLLRTVFSQLDGNLKGGVSVVNDYAVINSGTKTNSSSNNPPNSDSDGKKKMPTGHVVGVSCGIGLGCTFLLSGIYLLAEYIWNSSSKHAYQTLAQNKVISSDSLKGTNVVK
ncbi:Rax2 protein [Starmerella bacillaris]|uniref:Rax2 protein n=1 Tax=Starmerella bacillaris TaxID=1247836 RepID=A0AAV5RMG0_STABA|nr:Rax2 protein [Starmerella bacillaris]